MSSATGHPRLLVLDADCRCELKNRDTGRTQRRSERRAGTPIARLVGCSQLWGAEAEGPWDPLSERRSLVCFGHTPPPALRVPLLAFPQPNLVFLLWIWLLSCPLLTPIFATVLSSFSETKQWSSFFLCLLSLHSFPYHYLTSLSESHPSQVILFRYFVLYLIRFLMTELNNLMFSY